MDICERWTSIAVCLEVCIPATHTNSDFFSFVRLLETASNNGVAQPFARSRPLDRQLSKCKPNWLRRGTDTKVT